MPDHWYPKNLAQRAQVNEYLDWHHNNIRLGAGGYFFRKYVSPVTGKPAPQKSIEESWFLLDKSLKLIEAKWLSKNNKKYLFGNKMTIADLSLYCELCQMKAIKFDFEKQCPKIKAWMKRMEEN